MAREIERKFLVRDKRYRQQAEPIPCRQGYLSTAKERIVRVRIKGERAYLTVKGATDGITRTEYEYEIPTAEAEQMLEQLCKKPIIEKDRYEIECDGILWQVDEFHGLNEGLVVAEVHLSREDQKITIPEWVGQEVSHEPRYFSSSLVQNPYNKW
jgi:CYTH domain-containing protein